MPSPIDLLSATYRRSIKALFVDSPTMLAKKGYFIFKWPSKKNHGGALWDTMNLIITGS